VLLLLLYNFQLTDGFLSIPIEIRDINGSSSIQNFEMECDENKPDHLVKIFCEKFDLHSCNLLFSNVRDQHSFQCTEVSPSNQIPPLTPNLIDEIDVMKLLLLENRYDDTYQIAIKLLNTERYRNDPQLLIDLCILQSYRRDYESAYEYCSSAASLEPDSPTALHLLGVVSMYVEGRKIEAVRILIKSWQLQQQHSIHKSSSHSYLFTQSKETTELNLLRVLNTEGYYKECVDMSQVILDIPFLDQGGAYIIIFATVDWSPHSEKGLHNLEMILEEGGALKLEKGRTFLGEIRRIQETCQHVLVNALLGIMEYLSKMFGDRGNDLISDIYAGLLNIISTPETLKALNSPRRQRQNEAEDLGYQKGIALITQYFTPTNNSILQGDIDLVLRKNLGNPYISDIYVLTEELIDFSGFIDEKHKIRQTVIGERLTFSTAFTFANEHLMGRLVALVNADIYFDESLIQFGDLETLDLQGEVLALSRWSVDINGNRNLLLRTDAQDAWIFQPHIQSTVIDQGNFYLGVVKCDNRIAEILEQSGHHVYNPTFAIHAIEVHNSLRNPQGFYLDQGLQESKASPNGPIRDVLISDRYVF